MKFIATILLILMMLSHATCGVLLWRRRNETGDYSRYIQAVLSWASAFFTMTFIFRTWAETTTADGAFFEPEHTFVSIIFQMTYFLYPLEVIRPTVGRQKVYSVLCTWLLPDRIVIFHNTNHTHVPICTFASNSMVRIFHVGSIL